MDSSGHNKNVKNGRVKNSRLIIYLPTLNAFLSALVTAAVGGAVLTESFNYGLGSLRRLGSGFFPFLLGASIILMSILLLFDRKKQPILVENGIIRPLIFIIFSIFSFAILIQEYGLLPATVSLITLSCTADKNVTIKRIVLMSITIPPVLSGIFIYGIGVNIPAIRL